MNEEPQNEEEDFEDDADDVVLDATDEIELDAAIREIERGRKKAPKTGDPAWRKLERMREERHTAELISDFEDYDIGIDDASADDEEHSEFDVAALLESPVEGVDADTELAEEFDQPIPRRAAQ